MVLCPTRHKIGHIGDVLPSQSLGLVLKTKSKTTKANIHKKIILQHRINTKKLKPGLGTSYNLWPGNGTVLYAKSR